MLPRQTVLVALIGLAALLPFIGKPLFVDDHAHFAQAEFLASHRGVYPQQNSTMPGWSPGETPSEANPFFYFKVMASWIRVAGPQTWKAHLFLLPLHLLGLVGFFSIAKRYTHHPVWCTVLYLFTPHLLLTSQSLLVDSLLAPLTCIGLALWIRGTDSGKTMSLVAGALVLGLVPLVKYTGVIAPFAALLWSIGHRPTRFGGFRTLWLAIPAALFAAWWGYSRVVYGQSHVGAIAADTIHWPTVFHWTTVGAFLSGTAPVLLLPIFSGSKKWRRWVGVSVVSSILSYAGILTAGLPVLTSVALASWSGVFLGWAVITLSDLRLNRELYWLIGWLIGGLLMIAVARRWVCARYYVMITPAVILLTVRWIELYAKNFSARFQRGSAIVLGMFAVLLGVVDYQSASVYFCEAKKERTGMAYPSAHLSGLGYYIKDGARAVGPIDRLATDEILIWPTASTPAQFLPPMTQPTVVGESIYRTVIPLRTFGSRSGFYGSIWGPLPFSLSTEPLEKVLLVKEGG